MQYTGELSFLRDVLEKSRFHTEVLPMLSAKSYLEGKRGVGDLSPLFKNIRQTTVYKLKDLLECRYVFFILPDSEPAQVLLIGPYLGESISEARRLEIAERVGLSPRERRYFGEFYMGLPELTEDSHLNVMILSFCERIWNTATFTVEEIDGEQYSSEASFGKTLPEAKEDDAMIDVKAMEHRYAIENEMIRAVELGLSQTEFPFSKVTSGDFFEKRVADPLRNAKNYGIIMNTLLRKAAEKGGVHPIYLDRASSDFAHRLEKSATVTENTSLMLEMFRSYCRLVRKYRLKGYSLTVQKIILSIDADLAENLSSGTLAQKHGISLGYLSTVFKKETGKTVSEYIRDRRMEYARYLLGSTKLQIQTVAFNTGIMDVQYFSKLFKKRFGQTPSEYREEANK